MLKLIQKQSFTIYTLAFLLISVDAMAAECGDREAIAASMDASSRVMNGNSFRKPRVLKRHHPSKRKEVVTYFKSDDLYYTLYWLVSSDCQAGFIKRSKGKR